AGDGGMHESGRELDHGYEGDRENVPTRADVPLEDPADQQARRRAPVADLGERETDQTRSERAEEEQRSRKNGEPVSVRRILPAYRGGRHPAGPRHAKRGQEIREESRPRRPGIGRGSDHSAFAVT